MRLLESETLGLCEDSFETLLETPRCQVGMMVLVPGQQSGEYGNPNPGSDRLFFIVDGQGEVIVRRESTMLEKGDLMLIEDSDPYQIIARGVRSLRMLTFLTPPPR